MIFFFKVALIHKIPTQEIERNKASIKKVGKKNIEKRYAPLMIKNDKNNLPRITIT